MRLVRCSSCRFLFETGDVPAVCVACGHVIDGALEAADNFADETPEKSPTRKLSVIPPRK
jgi:hypothetical protein